MATSATTAVLVCFDDNYAPAACVMLTSLLANNAQNEFELYAITSKLKELNQNAIEEAASRFGRQIHMLSMDGAEMGTFREQAHLSMAAYFRLYAPDKIDAKQILYFDVDLIIQADIKQLFQIELGDCAVAGAIDNSPSPDFRVRLGLSPDEHYINTGVLLINADLWRKENITASLLRYHADHMASLYWADQDLINAALAGRKHILEKKWNLLYGDLIKGRVNVDGFDVPRFDGVLHYNTSVKPWHRWSKAPYRPLYQKYADMAPIQMPKVNWPRNIEQALSFVKWIVSKAGRQAPGITRDNRIGE